MAKICTTEKTASRQRWIEQGLLELMLEHRLEDISVSQLCLHLQLSRRSFYRYFDDLEDVLDSMLDHAYMDMAIPDSPISVEEMEQAFVYWLSKRDLLEALWKSGMSVKFVECTLRYSNLETMSKYLADRNALDYSREANLFINSGLGSLIISWFNEGFQKTPGQMAQIAHRLLTEPILKM